MTQRTAFSGIAGALVVIILTAVLLMVYLVPDAAASPKPRPNSDEAPMGVFSKAAVVSNGYLCAPIGKDILAEGGNAVDAAIATLLCEGILNSQSMSIGGGFLMTIYKRDTRQAFVLNARESAPAKADKDMYHGNATWSQRGGLSIAVPGELRGYQEAFDKFGSGKIAWSRLFEPTIRICREGYRINRYQADLIKANEADVLANPGLSEFLVDPETGRVLEEGGLAKVPKLAATLELVANSPLRADEVYNGSLTDTLVQEIQQDGGIITRQDFENYRVQWQEPVTAGLSDHTMFSVPLPGSGVVLAFVLNILDGILPADNTITSMQRMIEAFKFGYGRRTELGDFTDPEYVPDVDELQQLLRNLTSPQYAAQIRAFISDTWTSQDPGYYGAVTAQRQDHGTAHISVLGPNGDAVSATSTLNMLWGAQFVSPSSGILWNNEMDDFSSPNITNGWDLPPSPANFIFPGKRPISSMVPAVFVDPSGDVSLVIGATGGSVITTVTTQIAVRNILYGATIKEAIDAPRVHHQLFPMSVKYEQALPADVASGLRAIGHHLEPSSFFSSATGIARLGGNVTASFDFRRGGSVDGF